MTKREIETSAVCPYCENEHGPFDTPVGEARKCDSCGKKFLVHTEEMLTVWTEKAE